MPLPRSSRQSEPKQIDSRWSSADNDPPAGAATAVLDPPVPEVAAAEPIEVTEAPPEAEAPRTSDFVRIKHLHVGIYPKDSIVPVSAFENVQRLLDLEAVEYDLDATEASAISDDMAVASRLSQPVALHQTIPRAPWAAASVVDLIGPAVPSTASRFSVPPPYQSITVAEPQ